MRLILLMIPLLLSCSSSETQRLKIDFQTYQEVFKNNLDHFQLIRKAIDSIASKYASINDVEKSIMTLPIRFAIYQNKVSVEWSIELGSINGNNFYRIKPFFRKLRANCSTISYFYSDNSTLELLNSNTIRNVMYEPLDMFWALEVDRSSPCIE